MARRRGPRQRAMNQMNEHWRGGSRDRTRLKKIMADYKKKPIRFHTKPIKLADLASGVLARHHISRQVTAAMIVHAVNSFLDENLTAPLKNDARALSYQDFTLRIACKNPSASYAMQDYLEPITNHLKQTFPDIQINQIVCILNQDPWIKCDGVVI